MHSSMGLAEIKQVAGATKKALLSVEELCRELEEREREWKKEEHGIRWR